VRSGGEGGEGSTTPTPLSAIEAALLRIDGVGRALSAVDALAEELVGGVDGSGGSEEAAIAAITVAMEAALPFPLPPWFMESVELIQACAVRAVWF
jgi:hypothetical protein